MYARGCVCACVQPIDARNKNKKGEKARKKIKLKTMKNMKAKGKHTKQGLND